MRTVVTACLVLASLAAQSQVQTPITFSFKGILLNSDYSTFPLSYKDDCTPIRSSKTLVCVKHVEVGKIPMDAEFYFKDNRLDAIEAYFPADKYDVVIMALQKKYGKWEEWNAKQYVWYSTPPSLDSPPPDELTVLRVTDFMPSGKVGQGASGVALSNIRYLSMKTARDKAAARDKSSEQEISNASQDL